MTAYCTYDQFLYSWIELNRAVTLVAEDGSALTYQNDTSVFQDRLLVAMSTSGSRDLRYVAERMAGMLQPKR